MAKQQQGPQPFRFLSPLRRLFSFWCMHVLPWVVLTALCNSHWHTHKQMHDRVRVIFWHDTNTHTQTHIRLHPPFPSLSLFLSVLTISMRSAPSIPPWRNALRIFWRTACPLRKSSKFATQFCIFICECGFSQPVRNFGAQRCVCTKCVHQFFCLSVCRCVRTYVCTYVGTHASTCISMFKNEHFFQSALLKPSGHLFCLHLACVCMFVCSWRRREQSIFLCMRMMLPSVISTYLHVYINVHISLRKYDVCVCAYLSCSKDWWYAPRSYACMYMYVHEHDVSFGV